MNNSNGIASLAFWLAKHGKPHTILVMGKGGVGKTTVSIMLARALSDYGRVLVESLDQAMHLLEYLGLPGKHKEYQVRENLYAKQFDLEIEIKKLGETYSLLVKQIMPGLKVLNVEYVADMIKYAPGFEEEVYLRELLNLYRNNQYDFIIVDTPPTGLTLRILNMPRLYRFWIDRLISLRERIVSLRYIIARTAGIKYEPDDPVLNRLYKMKDEYEWLAEMLASEERTSFALVATPEALPVYEARKTAEFLRAIGARPKILVANRILDAEIAEKMGVLESQSRNLASLDSIDCGGPCARLYIPQSPSIPSSLEAVEKLTPQAKVVIVEGIVTNGERKAPQ